MILLPTNVAQAAAARGVIRAGGTDLAELRRKGISTGPVVDLRDVPGLDDIEPTATGGLRIGAKVTLAALARDPQLVGGWPALAAAARAAGTPQVRATATLGGNLLQEVRCAYFRSPEFQCSKKGGARCFARDGDAERHAALENGPCIATHPSSLALALLVYGATAELHGASPRDIPGLLGDGLDARLTHAVAPGQVLTAVILPATLPGERGGYARITARREADWPLVEAAVRVQLDGTGRLEGLAFAVNGVANRPREWPDAARACRGLAPDDPSVDEVFRGLLPRFLPVRQAAYKALLVPAVLREAMDLALGRTSVAGAGG